MARSEARIAVSIWSDAHFLALSSGAQRQFMFLLSQADLAHDGVIALRERRWARSAADLTAAQVSANLSELQDARFIVVDEDAEELLVRSFIRRDKVYRQPNVLRAAADHLRDVTSPLLIAELAKELDRIASSDDVPSACVGILAEMRALVQKGSGNPSGMGSGKGSAGTPGDGKASGNPSGIPTPNPSRLAEDRADNTVSAGVEGSRNPSRNPSGNPTPGTPGERGVVTAVTTASPSPEPQAPDPRPQPSAGGRASAREAPPDRCPKHLDDPDPPNCGRCAGARKAHARWKTAEVERRRKAPPCPRHRGQLAETCGPCRSERLAEEAS